MLTQWWQHGCVYIQFLHCDFLVISSVRSELEYASVAWNSVTITDSNKLERLQRKFAAHFCKRFFQDVEYHYDNTRILEILNLQTLHIRRGHFDALLSINIFSGTKHCPSVVETVGFCVPTLNICNFTTFCLYSCWLYNWPLAVEFST
jgi:hypothetical protein